MSSASARRWMDTGETSIATRRGFSLMEILVALAIAGILIGVVVVTVPPRLKDAEARTLEESYRALRDAVGAYKTNVGRYPIQLRQLVSKPGFAGPPLVPLTHSCGGALTTAEANRWRGPYLAHAATDSGLATAGRVIPNVFVRVPASSTAVGELVFSVTGVENVIANLLEARLDAGTPNLATGIMRWTESPVGSGLGTATLRVRTRAC